VEVEEKLLYQNYNDIEENRKISLDKFIMMRGKRSIKMKVKGNDVTQRKISNEEDLAWKGELTILRGLINYLEFNNNILNTDGEPGRSNQYYQYSLHAFFIDGLCVSAIL